MEILGYCLMPNYMHRRFASAAMDEAHLAACLRHVELNNPVRAGLLVQPQDWPWSGASAHLERRDVLLVSGTVLADQVGDWSGFPGLGLSEAAPQGAAAL